MTPTFRRLLLVALLMLAPLSPVRAEPRPLVGFSIYQIVSDRNRLIQGSVVMVAFGIALLWIGKK